MQWDAARCLTRACTFVTWLRRARLSHARDLLYVVVVIQFLVYFARVLVLRYVSRQACVAPWVFCFVYFSLISFGLICNESSAFWRRRRALCWNLDAVALSWILLCKSAHFVSTLLVVKRRCSLCRIHCTCDVNMWGLDTDIVVLYLAIECTRQDSPRCMLVLRESFTYMTYLDFKFCANAN